MENEYKAFVIDVGIYNCKVYVTIGEHIEKAAKNLKKIGGDADVAEFMVNNHSFWSDGSVYQTSCKTDCTLYLSNVNDALLVHELFHVTYKILSKIGMELSNDSEEAYAYLQEYLFNQVKANLI